MPEKSFPFASVIIKSKELKLLGPERILKLFACENAQAAASLLMEWGYGGGEIESPYAYERLISCEMDETYALIRNISPDPEITDLFFLRHDYHNLKVLFKAQETGLGAGEKSMMKSGTLEPAALLPALGEKKYAALTKHMREALLELDRAFVAMRDLSLIDVALDRAYAEEVRDRIRDKKGFIQKYFRQFFDLENLLILLRAREAKLSPDLFSRALLPEGGFRKTDLLKAYEAPAEELKSMIVRGERTEGIAAALDAYFYAGNLQPLEKYRDDALLKTAGAKKDDLFSIAPVMYYLVKKEREAKAVKMAMTAKLYNMKTDDVQNILAEV